jgi:hypothetical protein
MTPKPSPIRRSPGPKAMTFDDRYTKPRRTPMPAKVTTKPVRINVFCACLFANRSAPRDEAKRPSVAAVKISPVSIALYPRMVCRYTATTNDVPMRISHCMFCVTSARSDVRFLNRPVDRSGSLPARSRERM